MNKGAILSTPVDAAIVVLVDEAHEERLAICAGAGLSIASGLPSGPELARRLHERFQRVSGYACANPDDLVAVADSAASLPDGLAAIQRVILELAPFGEAPPGLAHQLLALLLAERALRLLLTNWDDCVERSWRQVEHLQAARNEVEVKALRGQFILKIHGCCTQSSSLLVTSEQLTDAPLWTSAHFEAELVRSTVVFVGIGDVADYAQRRVADLANDVSKDRVRVVSPSIQTDWETSRWRDILPDLPEDHRLGQTAEEFLDELAREWVMGLVESLGRREDGAPTPAVEAVKSRFVSFTAVQALVWLRKAAVGWEVGRSVVRDPAAAAVLEAIGGLAQGATPDTVATIAFLSSSAVLIGDDRYEVVLCREGLSSSDVEGMAAQRGREIAERLGPVDRLRLLVAAGWIRGAKPRQVVADDIVNPNVPIDELIDGPSQVLVLLTYADEVLAA